MAAEEFCRLGKEFGRVAKELYSAEKESCRLPKEFGQAKEDFYRLAKESGRVRKEFGLAIKEFGRVKLLSYSAKLLANRGKKERFARAELCIYQLKKCLQFTGYRLILELHHGLASQED